MPKSQKNAAERPLHVGLYSPSWPPEKASNGIVTYVHVLREELLRQGHRVSVFVGNHADPKERIPGIYPLGSSLASKAIHWYYKTLRLTRSTVFDWGHHLALEALRVHRLAPLDVFEMEESFGWFAALIDRKKFPVVVKLHGPAFLSLVEEELQTEFAQRKITAEGCGLQRARALMSPSACTLSATVARYELRTLFRAHVPNPLALAPSAPIWKATPGIAETILFVGRFDKPKGADRVLLAFKRVLTARRNARLVFVGPDAGLTTAAGTRVHFDAYASSIFSTDERGRVQYLGSQPPDVVSKLRTEAALTIVASRWESQCYTALEAMLQGCPLVCADNSALSESVQDGSTGILFREDDADSMADRIIYLLDRPELAQQIGRRAREYVLIQHDPSRIIEKTIGVYRSAIADFNSALVARVA
jgi:glycosyltransferase involved in cell wall biosynthesis